MKEINCIICGSNELNLKFVKSGKKKDEFFELKKCKNCGLEFVSPRPSFEEIVEYYNLDYFTVRTERGYNNYFSPELKEQINRVNLLNLKDLDFFNFENQLDLPASALDIGAAAGYFVDLLKERNWQSTGIDLSKECVDFGREHNLDMIRGNYLETSFEKKFDLITMWASIEHLHHPEKFLEKIYLDLKNDGMLYLSTCRIDGINFMRLFGKDWRFYNLPEHLVFFSFKNLKKLLEQSGFKVKKYITYGSGFGKSGSIVRSLADFFAKNFKMGDMMLISAQKK